MLITAIGVLLVMAKPVIAGGAPLVATDYPTDRYPVAALDYVRAHPDAVRGEMFNYFLWGGYIEFSLPQQKPFIDSRNYSYGIDLFHEFRTADEPEPGWEWRRALRMPRLVSPPRPCDGHTWLRIPRAPG